MIKHYDIEVYGKVQGVGFRYSCMQEAREIGLKGFVKNRPDGSVYIEAEGEDFLLERLIQWCKDGSSHAKVSRVEKNESKLENYSEFKIWRM
jgi:acylphosphatase